VYAAGSGANRIHHHAADYEQDCDLFLVEKALTLSGMTRSVPVTPSSNEVIVRAPLAGQVAGVLFEG
jgi:hypothetical protein